MDRGFNFHEHTADITIECWAPTLKEAFVQAAIATLEVVVDTSSVNSKNAVDISVSGIDLNELLVEWIGQIIALIDIKFMFFSKFSIETITQNDEEYTLEGQVWGETIDLERHDARTEVKAMTYADLKIITEPERTTFWFTLDL